MDSQDNDDRDAPAESAEAPADEAQAASAVSWHDGTERRYMN